jgi:hypothetical protein
MVRRILDSGFILESCWASYGVLIGGESILALGKLESCIPGLRLKFLTGRGIISSRT